MRRLLSISFLVIAAISLMAISGFGPNEPARGQEPRLERVPLSSPPLVTYDGVDYRLTVKFADSLKVRARQGGTLESLTGDAISGVEGVAERHGLTFRPQISLPESEIAQLEERAAARSGRAQPDLAGMMIVEMSNPDHQKLLQVARELRDLPEVEYVYLEPLYIPDPEDIPPTTPDLVPNQNYRGPDPGMDVDYALTQGGNGIGIRYSDCESAWNYDHEDLNDLDLHPEPGQTIHPDALDQGRDNHGTAVVGMTSAAVNAYGCSGMVPDAPIHTYPQWTEEDGWRRVDCVTNAINDSGVGDLVLLEMQTQGVGEDGNYVPAEYDLNVWTIVKTGTDAGVIIVGAAGNGGQDLDSDDYLEYMGRGDSGAIIVGGGSADTSHDKRPTSTYGSRVNLQGWGTGVFTLGYGAFAEYGGDYNQRYTDGFNGTSSASPFVASACMAVQSVWEDFSGSLMTSVEMRDHLIATGIPQGSGGHIGPFPNLRDAINELPGYNEPPVAICQDLILEADGDCQANATAEDVDNGSSDPDGDTITLELSPPGPYALGATDVTLTVTDEHGTSDSCTAVVTVVDTTPPLVTCPANVMVECLVAGGVPADDVQLVDFFAGFMVEDNCDSDPMVVNDAPAMFAGPCETGGGITTVTWTATDASGNEAQCSATVTVVDTTPPEIEVTVAPQVLWPPNHKMVDVEYTVIVGDICDDDVMWVLTSVISNEPENDGGDGDTDDDIQGDDIGTPDTAVSLRAERSGILTGRIYTATFTATDCSGNTAEATANVYVPHSRSDAIIMVSGGGLPLSSETVSYMVSGASLWPDGIPVDLPSVPDEDGDLRTIDPISGFITNTAGFVNPTALYVRDFDNDRLKDILMSFDRVELLDLSSISTELDGDPVMVLEVGEERFMILEMNNIQDTNLDLDLLIDNLNAEGEDDDLVVDQSPEVVAVRAAGIVATAPNPFNPKTTVLYYLPESGHVEVVVFDISGRMISRLVDQTVAAGEHSVDWTGSDSRGSRVASGVYFIRMKTGRVVDIHRVIMIK